ncbi:hypothetical protein ACFCYX_36140 [Streptomyces populi]|uniref:hypothetical protein n=1 Tax=Streptomyces populi TaxID=2058924 RepID=UPI0035DE2F07
MDATVTAAFITAAAAALGAAPAYAAGRAQARGAHRGPIDAVRRQHQRDAYAELIRAAWQYHASTGAILRVVRVADSARLRPEVLSPEDGLLLLLHTPTCASRSDLVDAFAPRDVPTVFRTALRRIEQLSPSWQQEIDDVNQVDGLLRAEVVVALEGPDQLAELARQIRRHAISVRSRWARVASNPFMPPQPGETELEVPPRVLHTRLEEAIREFTKVARAHLNTH